MKFRFGVMVFGFWKITLIAKPVEQVPQPVLMYLMPLDGTGSNGGKIFAVVEPN